MTNTNQTRDELRAALADPDPANPLAVGIAAALAALNDTLAMQAARAKAFPTTLIVAPPMTEVEAFAIELFAAELNRTGIRVTIKGH